jgi:hypothetical protein
MLSYAFECLKNIFMLRREEEVRKCKKIWQGANNTEMAIGHWRMWKLGLERG